MARRLPKPLVPVLVGVSAVTLALLAISPSFAELSQPVDPLSTPSATTPAPATPAPTSTTTWSGDLPVPSLTTKLDPIRDPRPQSPVGVCGDCLGQPNG
jgi:hypothetical protein